jgi:hypothetical protein
MAVSNPTSISGSGRFDPTNTSATAIRYRYAEGHAATEPVVGHARIGRGLAHDFQTIRPLAERDNARIVHWSEFDRGGHYAVLEVPNLVIGDLPTFFAWATRSLVGQGSGRYPTRCGWGRPQ